MPLENLTVGKLSGLVRWLKGNSFTLHKMFPDSYQIAYFSTEWGCVLRDGDFYLGCSSKKKRNIQVGEVIAKLAVVFDESQRSKAVCARFVKKFRSLQVWSICETITSYKSWLEKLLLVLLDSQARLFQFEVLWIRQFKVCSSSQIYRYLKKFSFWRH